MTAGLFLAMSAGQMLIWAQKKHSRYRKDFGKDYPRGRKAMIPLIF
jgi:very-long-chain enoyl-CoA reductase